MANKGILFAVVAVILCHVCVVHAVGYDGICSSTADCTSDKGLVCEMEYTSCNFGYCKCDKTETWDEEKCQPILSAGSACTATRGDLPEHSRCVDDKVICDDGYTAYSGDTYYYGDQCGYGTKGLGEECTVQLLSLWGDCYQPDSDCQAGTTQFTCNCSLYYILFNGVCRKAKLGEMCTVDYECGEVYSSCATGKTCECKSPRINYEGECLPNGTRKLDELCERSLGTNNCELGLRCDTCPGTDSKLGVYRCQEERGPDKDTDKDSGAIISPAITNILLAVFLGGIGKTALV